MKIVTWKKITIIGIAIFFTGFLTAQTSNEWLRQKETQTKYLLQQIAALSVYSRYLSKGYNVVKSGLRTIQKADNDNANIHAAYFESLTNVNPKIKKYVRVADIIALQVSIAKQAKKAIANYSGNNHLTNSEIIYLKNVANNLLADCTLDMDELFIIITNGNLHMKDDERIKAIDKLYSDMLDKQVFIRGFSNNTARLVTQRMKEENQLFVSKKINDIK